MKLYTEEQLRKAIDMARFGGKIKTYYSGKQIIEHYYSNEEIVEQLSPIELPTDEEIDEYMKSFPYEKHLDDGQYNDGVIVGAELAIEWVINKIKGGNK